MANDNKMESNLHFGIKSKSFKLDSLVNRLCKHNKLRLSIIANLSKLIQGEDDETNLDNRDLVIMIDQTSKMIIDINWIHHEAINGIILEEWIFDLNNKHLHHGNEGADQITPAEERGLRSFYSLLRLLPSFNISDPDLPIMIKRQEIDREDDSIEIENNSSRDDTDTDIDGLVGLRKSLVFLEDHLTMETSNKVEIMIGNRLKIKCIWRIHGFLKLIPKTLMDYSVSFENLSPSIIVTPPKKHAINMASDLKSNHHHHHHQLPPRGSSLGSGIGNTRALTTGTLFLKPKSKISSMASSPLSSGRRHSTNTSVHSNNVSSITDASIIQYIRIMDQGRREELKSLCPEAIATNSAILEERMKRLLMSPSSTLEEEHDKDEKKQKEEAITTESLIFQLKLF